MLLIVSALLNIIIDDENDNSPKFRRPFYKRSVTENSKNGIHIASIVADDADKNRSITYTLENPKEITDLVHLDHETGEMVVANKIDREMYSWLNYTVRATDSGTPPRYRLIINLLSPLAHLDLEINFAFRILQVELRSSLRPSAG